MRLYRYKRGVSILFSISLPLLLTFCYALPPFFLAIGELIGIALIPIRIFRFHKIYMLIPVGF